MTRYGVILWTGRALALLYTVAMLYDVASDGHLSREIRIAVIGALCVVFSIITVWQARIAYKYEGVPSLPMPFRWVVAAWFASLALLTAWSVIGGLWDGLYTDRRSSVVWWILITTSLWFVSRWVTVDEPHKAGIGETGSGAAPGD